MVFSASSCSRYSGSPSTSDFFEIQVSTELVQIHHKAVSSGCARSHDVQSPLALRAGLASNLSTFRVIEAHDSLPAPHLTRAFYTHRLICLDCPERIGILAGGVPHIGGGKSDVPEAQSDSEIHRGHNGDQGKHEKAHRHQCTVRHNPERKARHFVQPPWLS